MLPHTISEIQSKDNRTPSRDSLRDNIEQTRIERRVQRLRLLRVIGIGIRYRRQRLVTLGTEARAVLRVGPNTQDWWHACSIDDMLQELVGESVGRADVAEEFDCAVESAGSG